MLDGGVKCSHLLQPDTSMIEQVLIQELSNAEVKD